MPRFYRSFGEFRRRALRDPSTYLGGALLLGAVLATFFFSEAELDEYQGRVSHIVPIGLGLMGVYNLWRRGGSGGGDPPTGQS